MNEITIIHCDKCDGAEVIHERVIAPPSTIHLKMSEFVEKEKLPKFSSGAYYHTQYRMVCKGCGHIVRYSV